MREPRFAAKFVVGIMIHTRIVASKLLHTHLHM